jgi:hypothetical protein
MRETGVLGLFGFRREFVCEWGVYTARYSAIDYHCGRPIHPQMSVAPPWARARIVRAKRR